MRPYPDPVRKEETTWLSSDDLYKESMLTSTSWVEVGSGDLGQLYVEILGCSKLPNMDRAMLGQKTDAFASIVFEGKIRLRKLRGGQALLKLTTLQQRKQMPRLLRMS